MTLSIYPQLGTFISVLMLLMNGLFHSFGLFVQCYAIFLCLLANDIVSLARLNVTHKERVSLFTHPYQHKH